MARSIQLPIVCSLSVVAMASSCGQQCGQALLPHAHHHYCCCRKGDDSSDNGHSCSSGSNGVDMAANVVMGSADDVLCVNCQRHRKTLAEVVASGDCIVALGVVADAGSTVVPAMEELTQVLLEMTVWGKIGSENN